MCRYNSSSAQDDMWIQQGGGYEKLLLEVEELLTGSDGTLERLEKHLEYFDAKVLLSTIVQVCLHDFTATVVWNT